MYNQDIFIVPHSVSCYKNRRLSMPHERWTTKFFHPLLILVCIILFHVTDVWAEVGKGPLHVRNQFPPHLMFLKPVPDSPLLVPRDQWEFSLAADYASVFTDASSDEWSVLADMEMTMLELSIAYGITEYLSLSLDVPLVSMNDGFLDGFLENYHDALGVSNYGREKRPKDEFGYELKKGGETWFSGESGGLHLADISISAKLSLTDEKSGIFPASVSLAYTLKVPLGDESSGFGSGRFDHGISLLSQFRFSSFAFYLNPGIIFLSDPETSGAHVSVNNIFGVFAGGEYIYDKSLALSAQLNYYTSPFKNTGLRSLDDDTLELALGFTYELAHGMKLEFAFCEDLTYSSPDFNVHTRVIYEIGH
ncbi:DUF3187 family protein [Desulfococcaceae bacterium HSG8]|nr:DUF3187 family protein [Desulfococcaceae bacterium HSG8]